MEGPCVLKIYTKSCMYKTHLQEAVNVMKWQRQKNQTQQNQNNLLQTCPLNKQLGNARYWNTLNLFRDYHNFLMKWFDSVKKIQCNCLSCYSHHAKGEESLVLTSVFSSNTAGFSNCLSSEHDGRQLSKRKQKHSRNGNAYMFPLLWQDGGAFRLKHQQRHNASLYN